MSRPLGAVTVTPFAMKLSLIHGVIESVGGGVGQGEVAVKVTGFRINRSEIWGLLNLFWTDRKR